MKLLYLTPIIKGEGGIQKVLSVKTNYFIEKFNYQIDILTQNQGNTNLFFDFNPKIGLYDMVLSKNKFLKFIQYRNQIQKQILFSNPDFIIICDSGINAFLLPLFLITKKKIICEIHGSKYNEDKKYNNDLLTSFTRRFRVFNRGFLIKYFDYVVLLSSESLSEWKIKKVSIIANPLEKTSKATAALNFKKAIIVARHSYEKGLDNLLKIWQKVVQKYPEWILEIYGKEDISLGYKKFVIENKLSNSIFFFEPVKKISDKYLSSSMYLMTSRNEAFPLVLLEAMNFGLPCVAYDCPVGPRAIINNKENGFLIENKNEIDFVDAVFQLIENDKMRIEMGNKAKLNSLKYQIEPIMKQWNDLFIGLKN